ncbi:dihydrodipicolinate synthase family protein [Bifidobacterium sp. 82T10]|uniref:Dihydrodipicolinate synthase family protein n=1 Tax=Bifidobacterium miconis TaxID=2834435 RepID=A0ABS6WCY4_9BIFI|nr:dihydrodipicolinate synthase family protein [Bifidobacterium miconis]MBW3091916.1 dihydrodipicolinate synthase family protein [Bifidobacterium miconis]
MTTPFSGILCPSITIADGNGEPDETLWGRHLDHLVEAGVNGILLFGSIGEFYAYPTSFKKHAVEFAVNRIAGRTKVLVGVGDTDLDNVLDVTEFSERCGADGIVAVSPYYFGPSDAAAERYFGRVADSTRLPVLLYNFPARTGSDLNPRLVAALAAAHRNIVGIKDTVDTISHTRKVIAAARAVNPDFAVLSGFDEYYCANRIAGGDGVLCGLTNVEPETFVRMHRAWQDGRYDEAIACARRVSRLMAVYDQADLFITAIKQAVRAKGLPIDAAIREPMVPLTQSQRDAIDRILAQD